MDFIEFPKIARYSREVIVTEKIDGTNGCIAINEDGGFQIGSRSRWLTPETGDNHGFMLWALTNRDELMKLGPSRHFGEWWGSGIQRGYGLPKGEKRFSLFNVSRWADDTVRPKCCHVVPVICRADGLEALNVPAIMDELSLNGSRAAQGFRKPEGIVIFHAQGNVAFKKTFEKDDAGKGREPVVSELLAAREDGR
jgi:hypothetical protein